MNTNLIMGLLIQLVTALKEPTPTVSGSVTNVWITQPRTWTQIYTNGWGTNIWTLRYDPQAHTNQSVTFTDEAIRGLAKSGRICEVLGHRWYYRGPTTFVRQCDTCSVRQSRTEGEGK